MDQIAQILNAPELLPADIVYFARLKTVAHIGKRRDKIVDIHKNPMIPFIHLPGHVMKCPVAE